MSNLNDGGVAAGIQKSLNVGGIAAGRAMGHRFIYRVQFI